MRLLIVMMLLGIQLGHVGVSKAGSIAEEIRDAKMVSSEVLQGRNYWVELGAQSNIGLIERGFQAGLGREWEFFGVDLRYGAGSTDYGQIKSSLDTNQSTGSAYHSTYVGSEMSRSRNDSDAWKYQIIEAGISVEGRYHPRWLPLLSEKGRFGLGYGKFTDRANQLEFNGVVMNFEADLIYALSGTSRWSVVAALNWKSGNLLRVEAAALDSSDRHLPINWVGTSVGMHYSF